MSTVQETQPHRERTLLYVVIAVVVGALMIIGLFAFSSARDTRQAEEKADEFIASLAATGARTPDRDQVVRVLGSDGGAVCTNPNKPLSRAVLLAQLTNGTGGPGARPVVVDSKVFQGEVLIMKTYCPDELSKFQDFADKLKTADVLGE
jgi:Tfp pilus assembly protein FimT